VDKIDKPRVQIAQTDLADGETVCNLCQQATEIIQVEMLIQYRPTVPRKTLQLFLDTPHPRTCFEGLAWRISGKDSRQLAELRQHQESGIILTRQPDDPLAAADLERQRQIWPQLIHVLDEAQA
jgi:hypothetical protein